MHVHVFPHYQCSWCRVAVGTMTTCSPLSHAGEQYWWWSRVNSSSVRLWSFNTHTHTPLHNDTNTKWHNLMKFCSLKQVAVGGGGGLLGAREPLGSFSSSVSLNSFHEPIDVPVFSWPFSAVSHHWGMQIHIRTQPDSFPVAGAAARKRRGSAINEVRASFLSGPTGRERERPFPSKFSLSALTRRERKRTLGKVQFSQWRSTKSPKRKFSDGLLVTLRLD